MLDAFAAMAASVGRRSWIVVMVCVVVCAALAARIVAHVIEAEALADADRAPAVPVVALAVAPPPAAAPRPGTDAAEGRALVDRDMFCSSCSVAGPGPGQPPGPGVGVPFTSLPLVLVATSLGHEPIATVRDERSGSQGAYGGGDRMPGAGPIVRIGATSVDFENPAAGRVERLSLLAQAGLAAGGPAPGARPAPHTPWDDRVRALDDTHFEVDRRLVREMVEAAGKGGRGMRGMRMMPLSRDGKLAGIRVMMARPDSIAGVLGLRTGDTVTSVAGVPIDSVDRLLEVYGKLDDLPAVTVEGTRRGQPLALEYRLR
jgi:type II secretory pathway component PulC